VFNEPYDKQKHASRGITPQRNPIDENKYALHQIYWLIRRGEAIKRDKPICKRFCRMIPIDPGPVKSQNSEHSKLQASTKWKDIIAMSRTRQLSRLPSNLHEGDAEHIGEIISFLDPQHLLSNRAPAPGRVERKTRRTGLLLKNKEYWKIDLEVRAYVELADLRFEIWFADQPICEPMQVPVAWMYPTIDGRRRSRGMEELSISDEEEPDGEGADLNWTQGLILE
jgi:hypothetical protein